MPDVRPLVWNSVARRLRQMVAGDTLAWALLSGVPAFASRWPTFAEVTDKPTYYATDWNTTVANRPSSFPSTIPLVSGLQAALDGKQNSIGYTPTRRDAPFISDANTITGFQYHPVADGGLNTPNGSWTNVLSMGEGAQTNWRCQIAHPWFESELYFRSQSEGAWQPWRRLWHSGNFNPDGKANLTGAIFSGGLVVNGSGQGLDIRPGGVRILIRSDTYAPGGNATIDAVNDSNSAFETLRMRGANIVFNGQQVWHAGNFNPASKADKIGGDSIRVSQNWGPVDNSAFSGRFFVAESSLGSAGMPGYGFHKAGEWGWFLYAQAGGFRARRNDGADIQLLHDGISASPTINGEVRTVGGLAGFNFNDRSIGGLNYAMYATGGVLRLWSSSIGDMVHIAGNGLRAFSGLHQGQSDAGWNLVWNQIAPGGGASEYINNRQGGGGGHLFATRQNESQPAQQHHHLLSDGRMNVRTAAGNWQQQPRIFVGGSDPGGNASPGDLWFVPL